MSAVDDYVKNNEEYALAYVGGAAAMSFNLPTSEFLGNGFEGAREWYERGREPPLGGGGNPRMQGDLALDRARYTVSPGGVVVLGKGELSAALTVKVHRVTAGAREAIEKAGGKVELIPAPVTMHEKAKAAKRAAAATRFLRRPVPSICCSRRTISIGPDTRARSGSAARRCAKLLTRRRCGGRWRSATCR